MIKKLIDKFNSSDYDTIIIAVEIISILVFIAIL